MSAGTRQFIGLTAPVGGIQIASRDVNGDSSPDLVVTTPWLVLQAPETPGRAIFEPSHDLTFSLPVSVLGRAPLRPFIPFKRPIQASVNWRVVAIDTVLQTAGRKVRVGFTLLSTVRCSIHTGAPKLSARCLARWDREVS